MYVHIGNGLCLNESNIIAILNIDDIKNRKEYKSFYEKLLLEGKIIDISNGNAKSFILIEKQDGFKGYISNINAGTIWKRK